MILSLHGCILSPKEKILSSKAKYYLTWSNYQAIQTKDTIEDVLKRSLLHACCSVGFNQKSFYENNKTSTSTDVLIRVKTWCIGDYQFGGLGVSNSKMPLDMTILETLSLPHYSPPLIINCKMEYEFQNNFVQGNSVSQQQQQATTFSHNSFFQWL